MTFHYSTLSGPERVPAQDASELLGIARGLPRWDALIIVAENENYPRLHVTWHEGHGFVVHCFEDGESVGFFLAATTSFSSPEIDIEMGGQALEKWGKGAGKKRATVSVGPYCLTYNARRYSLVHT